MEKKRVLLVDDERNSLLIAGKFLSHLGYQYEETTSGANALEKVEKGGYHLVLLDHEMPEMNGVETAKKIRALSTEQRNIPIIMLTAHIRRKVLDSYKGVGVNDYLIKPFDPSELKEMIERYSWEAKPSTPMQSNSGVSQYQFIKLDYISRLSNGDRSFTK